MKNDRTSYTSAIDKIAEYERKYRVELPATERPTPMRVEDNFDEFVKEFGGEKISNLISSKNQMPLNADYIFRDHNVLAELKTLEGIFSGLEGVRSLKQLFIDAGYGQEHIIQVVNGRSEMPEEIQSRIMKRVRRSIEQRIIKARKQLRMSKTSFGDKNTRSMIIVAIDQPPIFGQRIVLVILAKLMGDNYKDEHIDGIIYINPNVPTKMERSGMEFGGWFPFYRDDETNDELSAFVNLLGNSWLHFLARRTGNTNPILEFDDPAGAFAILAGDSVITPAILNKRG